MGYETTMAPVKRTALFTARIVINSDRVGISAGATVRLSIYGLEFLCRLQQVLEIKDRSGKVLGTRQVNLKDGEICRVVMKPLSAGAPNSAPVELSGVVRSYYGPLFVEPYHIFPELGRIAFDFDFSYPGAPSSLIAVGVVESVEYM